MAKKTTELPVEQPNRKSRTDRVGGVPSKVNKTSRNDGSFDIAGPLAPQGNKRTGKDFTSSAPPPKGNRPDGLDDDLITRTGRDGGYTGARGHVHATPGIEAQRTGDNIEKFAQGDIPDDL